MSILDQKPKSALKEGFGTKFGIGLIVALSLSLAAFQIRAPYHDEKPDIPSFGGPEIINIDPVISHQRIRTVEPIKPKPAKQMQIVIGDPIRDPDPSVPLIDDLDFDTAIPSETINEDPAPEPPKPTRYAEVMPEFPGGIPALMAYLGGTPYCEAAKDGNYEGKMLVQFIVDTDGSIKDVELLNKVYPCLDQAVVNRIKHMPKWSPGYMGKRAVPVIMVAPINFRLN